MNNHEKWIIDTNVIVHWLMINKILEFGVQEFSLGQDFLNMYRNRYKTSLDLVHKVLSSSKTKRRFFITELSLNELFSGIKDEMRSIMLFMRGVPISRWVYKRDTKEVEFTEEQSRKVYELTLEGFDILFAENRFEIISAMMPSDKRGYFDVYSSLVFLNPEIRTQDAMLITSAIFEKANYFITTDRDLQRLSNQLKENYSLQVISPGNALQIIR